jgi:hypothetical protein
MCARVILATAHQSGNPPSIHPSIHHVGSSAASLYRIARLPSCLVINRLATPALFVWLISHQPAVLFSQNKSTTNNQTVVLFSQNKSAPVISHRPNEQAGRTPTMHPRTEQPATRRPARAPHEQSTVPAGVQFIRHAPYAWGNRTCVWFNFCSGILAPACDYGLDRATGRIRPN